uniref:Uncharacterized protein n=1 Tax=Oryza brachyantha TaxID=4533 RepID=J3NE88_ORYBR
MGPFSRNSLLSVTHYLLSADQMMGKEQSLTVVHTILIQPSPMDLKDGSLRLPFFSAAPMNSSHYSLDPLSSSRVLVVEVTPVHLSSTVSSPVKAIWFTSPDSRAVGEIIYRERSDDDCQQWRCCWHDRVADSYDPMISNSLSSMQMNSLEVMICLVSEGQCSRANAVPAFKS